METYIKTIAYEEDFKTIGRTGWGCGYVYIPKDHPILVQTLVDDDWGNYLTPDGCPEEITFSQWSEDKEYYIIGFDTAHSYNDSFTHNEIYVTAQANAIKSLVDDYTAEQANQYACKMISELEYKFNKYLIK